MNGILDLCANYFVLWLILGAVFGFGISGFYIDKNTNILSIEKQKKALLEKSMNIEALKNQFKDKSLSLGGTMGVKNGDDEPLNLSNQTLNTTTNQAPQPVISNENVATTESGENLNVPLNLG